MGEGPGLPRLTTAERDRRLALARSLMDEKGLDALLCYGDRSDSAGPPHFCPDTYFTNDRPGATVIVPRRGDPVALVWSQIAIADHYMATIRGEDAWLRPEGLRTPRSGENVARALVDMGLQRARIGILGIEPYGPFYPDGPMPYGTFQAIRDALPKAVFVPVWRRFAELILTKSDEEIEVQRHSAEIGEAMARAIFEATRPGVSEAEVYAAGAQACYRAGGNTFWMILLSGPQNIAWGPPPWTYRTQEPRVIREGDLVLAELFVTYGMMESQQQLTIAVGGVHPDVERAARAVRESYEIGLETLRPGTLFGDVVEAMDRPVGEAGGWNLTPHIHTLNPLQVVGRCGQGTASLPGMERYAQVTGQPTSYPDLALKPGMCFAFEPNCVLDRRRVNIGGTVALTAEGPVEMNDLPNRILRVQ